MLLIDTHAHLNDKKFARDIDRMIHRAYQAGVDHIVTIGDRVESSRKALALTRKNGKLSATVGIHPHNAKTFDPSQLEQIAEMTEDPHAVAIGEIGLDYHYDPEARKYQIPVFLEQIELAKEKNLPLVIHCRDAMDDLLKTLKAAKNPNGGIVHCFFGTADDAKKLIDMGYKLGVGGSITFPNAGALREVIQQIPVDHLVLETDSPYLAPQPKRGRRNEPAFIKFIAHTLGELLNLSIYDVGRATRMNAIEVYRLPIDFEPAVACRIRDVLYLNITNNCTNNCSFCTRKTHDWKVMGHYLHLDEEPSVEKILASIDDLDKYEEIVFGGCGEPTMRLDVVKDLARRFKEQGLNIRLNTNGHGQLINPDRNVIEELKGLIDTVSVALNVSTKKQYINMCNPRNKDYSYDDVKQFILDAKKAFPKVCATAVELPGVNIKACRRVAEEELNVEFRVREYFDLT